MPAAPTLSDISSSADENAGVRFEFSTDAADQPEWLVRRMHLDEQLSAPYELELELGTHASAPALESLLGKNVSVRWERHGEAESVHGIVARIETGVTTERMCVVHLCVAPALTALSYSSSSRIFAEKDVGQIVAEVLTESLAPFGRSHRFELSRSDYPRREYTVQHRETNLDFVRRLLAEQGCWFYFEQPNDGAAEVMVVTDSAENAPAVKDNPEIEVAREREVHGNHEAVLALDARAKLRPTSLFLRQFDWTHPELLQEKEVTADDEAAYALGLYEHGDVSSYGYQAPRYGKHDTDAQAQLRLDAARVDAHSFDGASNVRCLRAGRFATFEGQEHLLTRVVHVADCTGSADMATRRGSYRNTFGSVLRTVPYRPERVSKPRIAGVQTAIVADRHGGISAPTSSADGEDIVTDQHGRIRVKFHWDLTEAAAGGTASCWARVTQAWAGQGWGVQFIPRVGMEVVVQFIDGDPDQPVITGCVYNGLNPPPYVQKPTQSGIKTASSVDPSRYNELRFEDAKGHEQIFVRAQRDYVEEVMRNHTTHVHGNQTQSVSNNQSESIGGNASLQVMGNREKSIAGDEGISVSGARNLNVKKANTESYEADHNLTAQKAVTEKFNGSHDRSVTGKQTLEAKADKIEHVVGSYELTTDKAFVLNQGGTKLSYEGEKVTLDAANTIHVKRGAASVDIDMSGNISVKTTAAISLEVGANKIVLSSTGITIESAQFIAKAGPSELSLTPAAASLSSVNTTVEATALCAIKGEALLGLNS